MRTKAKSIFLAFDKTDIDGTEIMYALSLKVDDEWEIVSMAKSLEYAKNSLDYWAELLRIKWAIIQGRR